ncbi:MAG: membrane-bound PQQ-dependent dehydrogenase, glucose/quinate/shikimate family [Janthinobacterium lividum]
MAMRIAGVVLVLLGLSLLAGGLWLATLGGSPFYVLLGIALTASGYFLYRQKPLGRWFYAAFLLIDLVWAIWEVGFDWWPLVPRGVLFTLIGLVLLLPWFDGGRGRSYGWRGSRGALAGVIALVAVTALVAVSHDAFVIDGMVGPEKFAVAGDEPLAGIDWPYYGGDRYGRRYSSLTDINAGNVGRLKVAWTYHTGDHKLPSDPQETTFEVTPLKIGDTLYLCTPHNHVVALDPATGKEKWTFDPAIVIDKTSEHLTCRGVSYHADAVQPGGTEAPCRQRLIVPTMDARLFALDAVTGKRCADFGHDGEISLMTNMPNPKPGFYMVTSPPVIVGDTAIFGAAINDNVSVDNPSGVVRAYDVHSGKLLWNWDPGALDPNAIPGPGQTYSPGAPNMWSVGSADAKLGLVYVPLGNKSPDTWGAGRSPQVERFSSSIVALDIATGKLRWVAQTVHHDLWDRDVPAQPTLVDLNTSRGVVPALLGPTKQGDIFVLDRRTGVPILPVTEVAFDGTAQSPDRASPTQPVSALSFTPPKLRESDMWGATPFDQLACRIIFRSNNYVGAYTPPSLKGSIIYPGNTGVFNWGGVAVDPIRQVIVGSPLNLAFVGKLVPRANATARYVNHGLAAFGEDFGGAYAEPVGPLISPLKMPCQAPPWGSLVAARLHDGKTIWRTRNGTVRDQFPIVPIPLNLGVPGLGGPMITAGGVFFYSGTLDNYLRAYDIETGRKLWQARLPAGGQATPMTYRAADNRQMVVVAAGGHGSFGTTLGDAVVAFALDPK